MKYRLQEQEITEIILKTLNLPTRSELDDAYRSLYELRKEVKAIKKTLKEREGATAQVEATPAPKKTASKPAAKRKAATNQQAAEEPVPEAVSSGQ
jgi:peptidoglycan hydrolase CwlO-like protein